MSKTRVLLGTRRQRAMQQAQSYAANLTNLSTNKVTAVIIWLVGAWLTAQTLTQLGVPEPFNFVIGLAIQFALTRAETPLWRGQGMPKMALGATAVDIAVNSAGAWPYLKNLGKTDFWAMVRDILSQPDVEPTLATQLAIAAGVGAFTAAAAEYFWNLPD